MDQRTAWPHLGCRGAFLKHIFGFMSTDREVLPRLVSFRGYQSTSYWVLVLKDAGPVYILPKRPGRMRTSSRHRSPRPKSPYQAIYLEIDEVDLSIGSTSPETSQNIWHTRVYAEEGHLSNCREKQPSPGCELKSRFTSIPTISSIPLSIISKTATPSWQQQLDKLLD